eukprot:TRINITY_DN4793_c0_g1_i1.p5 TRINITY_DN4793_c0_g1~~TRINITY_DN4793_c0_g1_i1.p5  ORF type:complete len:102 (-),score=3.27 TRINITY_DN4793_c0_g1_i1:102-407(-)
MQGLQQWRDTTCLTSSVVQQIQFQAYFMDPECKNYCWRKLQEDFDCKNYCQRRLQEDQKKININVGIIFKVMDGQNLFNLVYCSINLVVSYFMDFKCHNFC